MGKMLSVSGLKKTYEIKKGLFSLKKERIRALWDVSFEIDEGKTLGVVGESGSGKSTLARCVLFLEKPDDGRIIFLGKDLSSLKKDEMRNIRKYMQIIFQDPYSSLNPRMRVIDILSEPILFHGISEKGKVKERVIEILKSVGMDEDSLEKYPHEMSGGQRQRIAIARAIATKPVLLVADEPLSALDLSIQAQILNLFLDIKEKLRLSLIFISHDLNVVKIISDYILVLFKGRVVEMGVKEKIFRSPLHPYTEMLLFSSLGKKMKIQDVEEENGIGCIFFAKCPKRQPHCKTSAPSLEGEDDHKVRCLNLI